MALAPILSPLKGRKNLGALISLVFISVWQQKTVAAQGHLADLLALHPNHTLTQIATGARFYSDLNFVEIPDHREGYIAALRAAGLTWDAPSFG